MVTRSAFDSSLKKIAALYLADEAECLNQLLPAAQLPMADKIRATAQAVRWVETIRRTHRPSASVTDLLARFGLSSHEGIALMCLAEALLRIPDTATADALIRDKLTETHWNEALGSGASWTMNATGWALSITGKIIGLDDPQHQSPGASLGRLVSRLGQPVIREAIKSAMQWLADQFVTGETIDKALQRTRSDMAADVRFSFDMLGEGARTAEDAERYYQSYATAIDAIGASQAAHKFGRASGISIKLSALHPRYEMGQRVRVMDEMLPRLADLCEHALRYDIPVTIDAEEADRLQLSLECAETLLQQAKLGAWEGLGFAVQAYQKRAPAVIDHLADLARLHRRRIHIRLVKGAYWDAEIKRSQERGLPDFPVYTRKAATDISYLACAQRMLNAQDIIFPVFGTHNALTVAHIAEAARDKNRIEFQRLHGMADDLYRLMREERFKTCVYAPVGNHDVLLGYLVRRILENGANSSFVHRLLDPSVSVKDLTRDPVEEWRSYEVARHPAIRRAPDLFGASRKNSSGLELADPFLAEPLLSAIAASPPLAAPPLLSVDDCFIKARDAYVSWSKTPVEQRAACLEKLADQLESHRANVMALLIKEGKKTISDALGEVREATDFCRYYAMRARTDFVPMDLPGPTGERNQLTLHGRGVFACISPWNFPLAIFLGQVVAALVSGNCVIAKPAPQTPRIAAYVMGLIKQSDFPEDIFHLVSGGPDVGQQIVQHPQIAGVAFTGSYATARNINRMLAEKSGPIVPLIAETGGQNVLIVDSSALPEQIVDDVIVSAFRSAGQRCSALRVLCLPEATADKILTMLAGAMQQLHVGDPSKLNTDLGPVIDKAAQDRLFAHVERLQQDAKQICTVELGRDCQKDTFFAPQAWEIPSIGWLEGEVFGPILHVIRYRPETLDKLIAEINATGYGLTGGVHSRIDQTVRHVGQALHVGNFYVNRSLIGAVVGVQPFGGEGMSGTGPKAGGPHYLPRFTIERVTSVNTTAAGGNASLMLLASQ
jgi:RHH-type proline utilization regulon transcriptional repressor/proline dehydrogenase/delta 1-pyrroline-5-carboxylate dehydrogenase